jgi:hypothetical protein
MTVWLRTVSKVMLEFWRAGGGHGGIAPNPQMAVQVLPFHSQVSAIELPNMSLPPNNTVTLRRESKAMPWRPRGGRPHGPCSIAPHLAIQLKPSNSQVSLH